MDQLIKKIAKHLCCFALILGQKVIAATEIKAEVIKTWNLASDFKVDKKKIGGLSGCAFTEDKVFFVSDNRGNEPKIISFPFDLNQSEINLKKGSILKLFDNQAKILDLEGIGIVDKNSILLSSEGDLNQKPRIMPEIFWIDFSGKRTKSIHFPKEFLPEKSGKQTVGIQTNLAFEGLVVDTKLKKWAAILEAPLLQGPKELLLVESEMNSENFDQVYSYPVPEDSDPENISGYFGATDLLFLDETTFLVLERGVQASFQGITYQTQLCTATKMESKQRLTRQCFYRMNKDSRLSSLIPSGANFEGLCWVNKQKKLFLAVSDNNFSKNEKTVLILYQLH